MPKIEVNGITLHYQQAGSGPDVVMIHGLAANLAFWYLKILPFLVGSFRVTVYDLRGHGHSDMPSSRYTSADMAYDLYYLLDYLGIRRAHLVGHSFGGLVALHFAVLFPKSVASLTIADSRISAFQPLLRLKDWSYWKLWKPRLEPLGITLDEEQELDYTLLETLVQHIQPEQQQPLKNRSLILPFETWNGGKRSAERWLRLLSTTTAKEDFKNVAGLTLDKLRQVEHPTRAIYGQYSFCLPSCRALRVNLPRCDTRVVPRAGHFHPVVKPRSFLKYLRQFLLPAH
jgi:pimeloyl-ACP methyl ester carboxylesterase